MGLDVCFLWVHGLAALVVHFTWTWASYVCQWRNTSVSYRLNSAFFKTLVVLELFVFSRWSMQTCFIQVDGLAALGVHFTWTWASYVCQCMSTSVSYELLSVSFKTLVLLELFVVSSRSCRPVTYRCMD